MKVWLRRLLLLLFVLIWLGFLLIPSLAFTLARINQVQIGRSEGRHWRVFLMQEDAEGLGLERSWPVPPPDHAPPPAKCLHTKVDYWLWAGDIPDVNYGAEYCQCFDEATGRNLSINCLTP